VSSLRRTVVARGVGVVVATLALVGVGTATLVHLRARAAVDQALTLAAYGAHDEEGWGLDHAPTPIRVRQVTSAADEAEASRLRRARATERPVFFDDGDRHGVVVVLEREAGGREEHRTMEAVTRRARVLDTAGPFLAAYTPLALLATGLAALGLRWLVRAAMEPLRRTEEELEAIRGPASGRRVTEGGPDEVRAAVGAVNHLLDRLEAAHAAQQRFTAEAAHELRTPVTSLRLALDLALRHPRTAEAYREALAEASESTDRLQRLVEGLVVLARIDGGQEVPPAVRAVRDLVRDALAEEAPDARADEVGDERVVVHPELAGIALRNLVRNAVRHSGGAPVALRTRAVGDWVRIEVEDRGPGVPADDRERLFAPLTRGARARAADPAGLGLGLSLARRIARSEGGDCVLEEAEGGGTRAVLTLRAA
jgi:signal transduction histidine kinase